jgi:RimJ/RimL family protein N-acetyltransferase
MVAFGAIMPLEMSFTVCDFRSVAADGRMMLDWSLARTMGIPMTGPTESQFAIPNARKTDVLWECSASQAIDGYIGLASIDPKNRHCELVFVFSGNASEFINLAVRHAFSNLGLLKVHCLAPSGNPSCNILEGLNFKIEAVMRKHCLVNGKYCDINWYGLLRSESDWEND